MGYPPQGQDPYGQQQPYQDPYGQQPQYGQPQYGQPQPDPYAQPQQPAYQDPYAQPQQPAYQDPYAQQPPVSGTPYPTSGGGYPTSGGAYPPAGYGTPGYQQPGYGQQQPQNTLGLVSMILGIVSIPFACCYIGLLLGAAAIVLGYLGQQKVKQGLANNGGMALAGIITGAVGVVIEIAIWVLYFAGAASGWFYTY
ncbi:hypothetical protein GCM10009827_022800 [Dactylosporangium maewongense]|uniref:DUF4190 domain-containing protein n=1 Tax=Dactylosporangium maewongense TaxID=634393 RepID=A0ABN1ZZV9_9ACTN